MFKFNNNIFLKLGLVIIFITLLITPDRVLAGDPQGCCVVFQVQAPSSYECFDDLAEVMCNWQASDKGPDWDYIFYSGDPCSKIGGCPQATGGSSGGFLSEAKGLLDVAQGKAELSNLEYQDVISVILIGMLTAVGTIFLAFIIIGGVLWMTAGGNEEQVSKAKKILTNSIIGLAIIILSGILAVTLSEIMETKVLETSV